MVLQRTPSIEWMGEQAEVAESVTYGQTKLQAQFLAAHAETGIALLACRTELFHRQTMQEEDGGLGKCMINRSLRAVMN